jgi:hypothetical protein
MAVNSSVDTPTGNILPDVNPVRSVWLIVAMQLSLNKDPGNETKGSHVEIFAGQVTVGNSFSITSNENEHEAVFPPASVTVIVIK